MSSSSIHSLLDEIQELTRHYQSQNDLLKNAMRQRDEDAERISILRGEFERLQEQASKSEIVAKTLSSKYTSSTTRVSSSSSSNNTNINNNIAQLSAGDLLKATISMDDDDDEDNDNDEQQNNIISPQSKNFRGLQKLSNHRNQQVQFASNALERARENSFQSRLHAIDRLKGKALESVVNLFQEQKEQERSERIRMKQQQSSSSVTSNNSLPFSWGPRATSAFASNPTSKKFLVSSDVLDDAIKRGMACWLDWSEGILQDCSTHAFAMSSKTKQMMDEADGDNHDDDDNYDHRNQRILNDDGNAEDERQQTAKLFRALLISSQFSPGNDGGASFNLGLSCADELKLCKELMVKEEQEEDLSSFEVADRAREFFEKMTEESHNYYEWPMAM